MDLCKVALYLFPQTGTLSAASFAGQIAYWDGGLLRFHWAFFPRRHYNLGKRYPSRFFDVLETIFSVSVILLWIVVTAGTAKGVWNGQLFHAPCLAYKNPKENGVNETNVVMDNRLNVGLLRSVSYPGVLMYRCIVRMGTVG